MSYEELFDKVFKREHFKDAADPDTEIAQARADVQKYVMMGTDSTEAIFLVSRGMPPPR